MRNDRVKVLVVCLVILAFSGFAFAAEKKAAPSKASAGKATFVTADQLKWAAPPNSPPGVTTAVLWGDMAKGPHGVLHKFTPGFKAGLHHHTADYRTVVISGTLVVTPEGGTPMRLGPGAYAHITGKARHTTECDPASECMIFLEASGPWDVVMETPAK